MVWSNFTYFKHRRVIGSLLYLTSRVTHRVILRIFPEIEGNSIHWDNSCSAELGIKNYHKGPPAPKHLPENQPFPVTLNAAKQFVMANQEILYFPNSPEAQCKVMKQSKISVHLYRQSKTHCYDKLYVLQAFQTQAVAIHQKISVKFTVRGIGLGNCLLVASRSSYVVAQLQSHYIMSAMGI